MRQRVLKNRMYWRCRIDLNRFAKPPQRVEQEFRKWFSGRNIQLCDDLLPDLWKFGLVVENIESHICSILQMFYHTRRDDGPNMGVVLFARGRIESLINDFIGIVRCRVQCQSTYHKCDFRPLGKVIWRRALISL